MSKIREVMSEHLTEIRLDEAKKSITQDDAIMILKNAKIDPSEDFHALPSSKVEALLDASKNFKYKKPKSASGSFGRYFHAHLIKKAKLNEDIILEGKISKASLARVHNNNKDRVGKTYVDDIGDELRNSMVLFINTRYMNVVYKQLDSYRLRYVNFATVKVEEFRLNGPDMKNLQKFKV